MRHVIWDAIKSIMTAQLWEVTLDWKAWPTGCVKCCKMSSKNYKVKLTRLYWSLFSTHIWGVYLPIKINALSNCHIVWLDVHIIIQQTYNFRKHLIHTVKKVAVFQNTFTISVSPSIVFTWSQTRAKREVWCNHPSWARGCFTNNNNITHLW